MLVLAMDKGPSRYRPLLRHILGSATPAKIDPQGRLVIPKDILDWANLSVDPARGSREVLVVGVGECVEVWNPEFFATHMKDIRNDLPVLWDEVRVNYSDAAVRANPATGKLSGKNLRGTLGDDEHL